MVDGLDHMQLAMPRGGEERARRAYFAGSLGLEELETPLTLAGRAGSGLRCRTGVGFTSGSRSCSGRTRRRAPGLQGRGPGRAGVEAR